jgi:hypothetical protein
MTNFDVAKSQYKDTVHFCLNSLVTDYIHFGAKWMHNPLLM